MTQQLTIKPFNRNYRRDMHRPSQSCALPCGVCGKLITDPERLNKAPLLAIVDGGARFALPWEKVDRNDPGFMGFHPIGSDCYRTIKRELLEMLKSQQEEKRMK